MRFSADLSALDGATLLVQQVEMLVKEKLDIVNSFNASLPF